MLLRLQYRLFICFLSLAVVTGCTNRLRLSEHDTFSTDSGVSQISLENSNTPYSNSPVRQEVEGDIVKSTDIGQPKGYSDDDSVEIFDMEPIAGYTRDVQTSGVYSSVSPSAFPKQSASVLLQPIEDSYGQGVLANDTSVMIYDVNGQTVQTGIDFNRTRMANATVKSFGPSVAQHRSGNQIFFKHGSSRLGTGDMRKISSLAEDAKFAPVNYISVEGYASRPTQYGENTTQAHIINLRQSMKRSEKVSKALISKGVPGEKIKTVSWGATRATGENAFDRRVDVNIGGQ